MAERIPAHRRAVEPRSGDTHVIGKDGKLVNVDALARGKTEAEAKPEASAASATRDPLDHDGDGHKGGSLPGEQSTRARGRKAE